MLRSRTLAAAILASAPLVAHHTGSTLLSETTVTLKGVVKTWLWSNPHCLLTMEVTGADGQIVQWVMEAQAPTSIYPAGYRNNTFKPGDVVAVTAHPVSGRPGGLFLNALTIRDLPGLA